MIVVVVDCGWLWHLLGKYRGGGGNCVSGNEVVLVVRVVVMLVVAVLAITVVGELVQIMGCGKSGSGCA